MKIYGIIYKITNKLDGKIYVGKTTQTLSERLSGHMSKYTNCNYIGASLRKHGVDNFIVEEIYFSSNKEDLSTKEKMFITQFNCLVPNGYNILFGDEFKRDTEVYGKILKASQSIIGWARTQPLNAYNIYTKKTYFFPRIIDATKKTGLTKSIIEKNISHNRISHGYIFSHANQSGSVIFKNMTHAQRLEVEPANAEQKTSTSVRVPRCYDFSEIEIDAIKKLYQTRSYREVAKEIGVSEARCARLLRKFGIMRDSEAATKFRDGRRNRNMR